MILNWNNFLMSLDKWQRKSDAITFWHEWQFACVQSVTIDREMTNVMWSTISKLGILFFGLGLNEMWLEACPLHKPHQFMNCLG